METTFARSSYIINKLAEEGAQTPPLIDQNPIKFIHQSLGILGHTFDVHDQRLQQRFCQQQQTLDSKFQDIEERVNERFERSEEILLEQFTKVNDSLTKIGQRLEVQEKHNVDFEARLDNEMAIAQNRFLDRMHHEILPVTVCKVKLTKDSTKSRWISSPYVL